MALNFNPNAPVYVAPKTISTQTDIGTLPTNESLVNKSTDTVAGQLSGILSSGSPVLQAAQTKSDQVYNSRGLLQSQGGVRAGTAAVIDKGLEIATPDAQFYQGLTTQKQKTILDSKINSQLAGIDEKATYNDALYAGSLETQKQEGTQTLQNQADNEEFRRLTTDIQGKIDLQKVADTAQLKAIELEGEIKKDINLDTLNADAQKVFSATLAGAGTELQGEIERILRDPNIANKGAAIAAATSVYRTTINTASVIAGVEVTWSPATTYNTTQTTQDEDGNDVTTVVQRTTPGYGIIGVQ